MFFVRYSTHLTITDGLGTGQKPPNNDEIHEPPKKVMHFIYNMLGIKKKI
jgi:hypothetical protein